MSVSGARDPDVTVDAIREDERGAIRERIEANVQRDRTIHAHEDHARRTTTSTLEGGGVYREIQAAGARRRAGRGPDPHECGRRDRSTSLPRKSTRRAPAQGGLFKRFDTLC